MVFGEITLSGNAIYVKITTCRSIRQQSSCNILADSYGIFQALDVSSQCVIFDGIY